MVPRDARPPNVNLFFALTAARAELMNEAERALAAEFGEADALGEPYDFDAFTDYYRAEFGVGLIKRLIGMRKLICPEGLVDAKLRAIEIERDFAERSFPGRGAPRRRSVNIDPGYLSECKVVLATTKDHAHRLYMGRGVFEEVTLNYRRAAKSFEPCPWTYPDYRAPERIAFFDQLRERYRGRLGALK